MEKNYKKLIKAASKEELLYIIYTSMFSNDYKKIWTDILSYRWEITGKKLLDKSIKLTEDFAKIDFAKRDNLAKQFNETKDLQLKLNLLEKLKEYDDIIKKYFKDDADIKKAMADNDKLFEQIQELYKGND